jgi:hypothetical protein
VLGNLRAELWIVLDEQDALPMTRVSSPAPGRRARDRC